MKIFNLILAGIFFIFAFVQLNDPDPLFWTLIYSAIAVITVFAAFGKYHIWSMLALLAIIIYELFLLIPSLGGWFNDGMPSIVESMKAESPHIEFVREFLGLIICLIALLYHYFVFRKLSLKKNTND